MSEQPPPIFTPEALTHAGGQDSIASVDGREWKRIVFGESGICAAEDTDGSLHVWDQQALFDAVFRRWGE